jgi:hypothetical protein
MFFRNFPEMVKKRDNRPPTASKQLRLGDRPPFISKTMHNVLIVLLAVIAFAFIRYLQYSRITVNPQLKSDLKEAAYSDHNQVIFWGFKDKRGFD